MCNYSESNSSAVQIVEGAQFTVPSVPKNIQSAPINSSTVIRPTRLIRHFRLDTLQSLTILKPTVNLTQAVLAVLELRGNDDAFILEIS